MQRYAHGGDLLIFGYAGGALNKEQFSRLTSGQCDTYQWIFNRSLWPGTACGSEIKSHWENTVKPSVVPRKQPVCSVCGFVAETKGGFIHADEVWSFPEPPKVLLIDIRPLCIYCHEAKDFGDLLRCIREGKAKASMVSTVMEHYCRINACSRDEFD
jgi:hypothetical protein